MTEITLYYANWCGHCKTFKPIWEKLTNIFEKNGIKYEAFEESENKDIIEKNGINSFPTIIIIKDGKKEEYAGQRTMEAILSYFGIQHIQEGGSKQYYKKYKKYKSKYLELKELKNIEY